MFRPGGEVSLPQKAVHQGCDAARFFPQRVHRAFQMRAASPLGRLVTGWLIDRFFAPRLVCCLLALTALGLFVLSTAHSFTPGQAGSDCGEADITPSVRF